MNSFVSPTLPAIKQAKLTFSSSIIGRVESFGYVIFSSAGSWRINNLIKWANFSDNGARDKEFVSPDGVEAWGLQCY